MRAPARRGAWAGARTTRWALRTLTALVIAISLVACARRLPEGPPVMGAEACQPGQVRVLVLGTFHFAQQDEIDIESTAAQAEISDLVDRLAQFEPDRVTVEYPYAGNERLQRAFRSYLDRPADSLGSTNEIYQVAFRLARRLDHDTVFGVDVDIDLWHDSIRVFDDRYPDARSDLRRRWNLAHPPGPRARAGVPLVDLLRAWNGDRPPSMPEYGRFMPLVQDDIYAGALKLRPWYDRNLRIVQNFFRVLDPDRHRSLFMVVGGSHVRVLRHILEMTPQMCAVDPMPYLEGT